MLLGVAITEVGVGGILVTSLTVKITAFVVFVHVPPPTTTQVNDAPDSEFKGLVIVRVLVVTPL